MDNHALCVELLLSRRLKRVEARAARLTGRPRMAALGEKNVLERNLATLRNGGALPKAIDADAVGILRAEILRETMVLARRIVQASQPGATPQQQRGAAKAALAQSMLREINDRIDDPPAPAAPTATDATDGDA